MSIDAHRESARRGCKSSLIPSTLMTAATIVPNTDAPPVRTGVSTFIRRHPTVFIGSLLLLLIVGGAVFAPWLGTVDPIAIDPTHRLKGPSAEHWFGTDRFGRDLYSRVMHGGRVSLVVGASVALLATMIEIGRAHV